MGVRPMTTRCYTQRIRLRIRRYKIGFESLKGTSESVTGGVCVGNKTYRGFGKAIKATPRLVVLSRSSLMLEQCFYV
jgi:hypothetical protein